MLHDLVTALLVAFAAVTASELLSRIWQQQEADQVSVHARYARKKDKPAFENELSGVSLCYE